MRRSWKNLLWHGGAAAMIYLLALALSAPSALAQGRGKISGKVMDASSGDPLPGVNVIIVGTTLGTASDRVGDYFIANLQPGVYSVRASFIGYRDVTVQDVSVRMNGTTELDFRLEEATIMTDEVVVMADRPLVERDNTTSVVRLEAAEVVARPTTDFTDVLTSLPSINMEGGQLKVRGGTLDQVAFMVDGARARNPLDHSPYTRINLSAIGELEVITGSFNAEYGEAQSGVINVVTKEGGNNYEFFLDGRFQPPGLRHWGTSLYDQSTDLYWENRNARHLDWWIEYPDQWVDPNGFYGSDPRSEWTAEQAYENYLQTHKPLSDYTNMPTYQTEVGLGGPVPGLKRMTFFGTVKVRSEAPLLGNAYRERGSFTDATLKLSMQLPKGMKLTASGFFGDERAGWGYYPDAFWAITYGVDSRYAYYDFPGMPTSITNGQTVRLSQALNASTLYEVKLTRVQADRKIETLPGDPLGFNASDATRDYLRAVDANGVPIPGGFANRIGYNTTGYYFRYDDTNTEWNLDGFISSQVNKFIHLQSGLEYSLYRLDHFNKSKLPDRTDDRLYKPYQGAAYAQSKIEVGGLIMNAGLRFDFYNPNDTVYVDLFDPLAGGVEKTKLYTQLSPRLGISHPIDERTVLHFSYGHFFQRPPYNDYGEGNDNVYGSLNTFIVDGTNVPWVLGNRNLKPQKTIAFEVGLERNFWDVFVLDMTGYYKDYRNTIRTIFIESPQGTYRTTGNGNYADERGVELSIRKVPSNYRWGSIWGYANFTTRLGIAGRSGDPSVITPKGVRFDPSGDFILHNNPRVKAGFFYQTPQEWDGVIGALLRDLSLSVDYVAVFANDQLRSDFFVVDGKKYTRPVDQNLNLRARREISVPGGVRISPYVDIDNVLNQKWIFLQAFERASREDQRKFVESGFDYLPTVDASGKPILEFAKFRNLPRQVIFGVTVEL